MNEEGQGAGLPGRLGETMRATAPEERKQKLMEFLREQLAERIGLEPSEIGARDNLMDIGVNSMRAVELKLLLEKELGLELSSSLLFDYPNLEALVAALLAETGLGPSGSDPAPRPPQEPRGAPGQASPGGPETSSVDELEDLLAAELERANSLLGR